MTITPENKRQPCKIKAIKGEVLQEPIYLQLTVRGLFKKNPKSTECSFCKVEIPVGEQYFIFDDWMHGCMVCVDFE